MLEIALKIFITLLSFNGSSADVVKVPGHTKYISLKNRAGLARSILVYLNPNEYNTLFSLLIYGSIR